MEMKWIWIKLYRTLLELVFSQKSAGQNQFAERK
jgi:hypothetical protein